MDIFNRRFLLLLTILLLGSFVRLYRLTDFPVSVYSDEASLGYNAYSILQTGKDEFGRSFPVAFQSFGDWKTALPAYLAIPSIYIFGLTPIGLRLSDALIGSMCVLGVYLLIKSLFENNTHSIKIALIGAFLFSISPWHILHSRTLLFEGLGLFFLIWSIYFFLKGLRYLNFFISAVCLSLSLYSYHSLRLVTPLLFLFLLIRFRKKIIQIFQPFLFFITMTLFGLLPLIGASIKTPDVLFGRAKYVSIFYDQGIPLKIQDYERGDGLVQDPRITNLFHNKPYQYSLDFLHRYFSEFNGNFLFLDGDHATPFQISNMGILYIFDLIFLIGGIYIFIRLYKQPGKFMFYWLAISILPAALTFLTPSSNRIFNSVFPFVVICALGISYVTYKNKSKAIRAIISIGYAVSFAFFLHQYFIVMPQQHATWWHYGFKDLVALLMKEERSYDRIIMSDRLGVPYIFFLYNLSYDPKKFQSEANVDFHRNDLGFIHVNSFGRFEFKRNFDWKIEKTNLWPHSLYVIRSEESTTDVPTYEIKDPQGKSIFKLYASDSE